MNDTCTTHRSRVPQRSFGRVKWGVTTVEDERGPGLEFYFVFCVRQSSVRGCRFSFVFLYLIIKMCWMFAGSRLLLPVLIDCVTILYNILNFYLRIIVIFFSIQILKKIYIFCSFPSLAYLLEMLAKIGVGSAFVWLWGCEFSTLPLCRYQAYVASSVTYMLKHFMQA